MSRNKRRKSGAPLSLPPERIELDPFWDDPPAGLAADDEAFDRTTAVPSIPSEAYAKRVMAEAERSEKEGREKEPAPSELVPYEDFSSVLPPLPTEPPEVRFEPPAAPFDEKKRMASTLPPPNATGKGTRRQRAVTRKEAPAVRKSAAPTSRPRAPLKRETPKEPSGLELAPISARAGTTRPPTPESGKAELKDRYAMGDFSGALILAESMLESDPDDLEAQRYAQSCRDVLMQMYSERMGSLGEVPRVAIPGDQIRWLSLDHRSGFMLSLVDGTSTIDEILDICGMARLDALRILYTLLEQRVISLAGQRRG